MLYAGAQMEDGILMVVGMSEKNVERMRAGDPMLVDLSTWGIKGRLILFTGETEESMATEMQALIGPNTTVKVDPKLFGGSD